MDSEIFRFSTTRPAQLPDISAFENLIQISVETTLISAIRKAREKGDYAEIRSLAKKFAETSAMLGTAKNEEPALSSFYNLVKGSKGMIWQEASTLFSTRFGVTPHEYTNRPAFVGFERDLANSLLASVIVNTSSPHRKLSILNLVRAIFLIKRLADNQPFDLSTLGDLKIVFPNGIFPLPSENASLTERKKELRMMRAESAKKSKNAFAERVDKLQRINETIEDVISAYKKEAYKTGSPKSKSTTRGFGLSESGFKNLKSESKKTLEKLNIRLDNFDMAKAVELLESEATNISRTIFRNTSVGNRMSLIGNTLFPDFLQPPNELGFGHGAQPLPGQCPARPLEAEQRDELTLPHGHGEARILGISDLMLVEQKLKRYELGEIAHIENVLRSEVRERKTQFSKTTDQIVFTETEEVQQNTKDLATTDRAELQSDVQKVISENSSFDAGVTVNASYGPSVDISATSNYASADALQNSQSAASTFAQETTSRAVSKLEKRKLERRSLQTIEKVIETNRHLFENNKSGADNISGVYRWVNKVYSAQVINYGKRLMLEFVVPEPAAFIRYALSAAPEESNLLVKPEPPGYCINNAFVPLNVGDITRDNYIMWTSRYDVQDVMPPPSRNVIISHAASSTMRQNEEVGEDYIGSCSFTIDIPEDYYPLTAKVMHDELNLQSTDGDGGIDSLPAQINILIDDERINNGEFPNFYFTNGHWKNIGVAINILNKAIYAVVINIFCLLKPERFDAWQIQTYNAIMNAYQTKKTNYENNLEMARIRNGRTVIKGQNPLLNRDVEVTELKKGCISLLTGQRYELFDAVLSNGSSYGYPEIDFTQAKQEGRYIQFFENAIEWRNMTYVFYPYFWGKKSDWLTVSKISDTDPLYTKFLQAGGARVQVPIRPGFEKALLHYLSLGEIWDGEGVLVNVVDGEPDPLHISVLEELKGELGNQNVNGEGTLTVTQGSTKVTGEQTRFSSDLVNGQANQRILIAEKTYVVKKVISETEIELTSVYSGVSESGITYSLGAKIVANSWEVKLPTDLVIIDGNGTLAEINLAIAST